MALSLENLVREKVAGNGDAQTDVGRHLKKFLLPEKDTVSVNTSSLYTDGFCIQRFNRSWIKHITRPLMVVPMWSMARLFSLLLSSKLFSIKTVYRVLTLHQVVL